jgi:transcriptional regulator with XRE-family HTH domain
MFTNRDERSTEPEDLGYELARLPRDITTAITWFMRERGITKRQLASRMKVTPGRVSQILSGDENLTLRSLAAVCAALDAHFEVDLVSNISARLPRDPPVTTARAGTTRAGTTRDAAAGRSRGAREIRVPARHTMR